uniref:Cadherin-related 23 n=1 Tax=Hucho hucho TaxID=62062 RepID=A0A4W5QR00_9TELE
MLWSVGFGGRMTVAKLLLFFFILHMFCEGTSVTQLEALDPEQEPLIFGVVGEEAMRYFAVARDTGVVWLRQPLDRETKSEMQVEFSVSDSQGVVKDTVNIQIGDVNDNSPTFHGQLYTVRIAEVGYSHVQYVCVVV